MTIHVSINDFYRVIHNEDNSGRDTGSGETFDRGPGGDRDRIDVGIYNDQNIGTNQIRVSLSSQVTWHKEIKGIDNNNQWMGAVFTQDDQKGSNDMVLDLNMLKSLIFGKAKMFGAHTDMYELDNLQQFAGMTLSFMWIYD